jgi:hypothetical protein
MAVNLAYHAKKLLIVAAPPNDCGTNLGRREIHSRKEKPLSKK